MKIPLFLVVLAISLAQPSSAQTSALEKVPLPSGPLLSRAAPAARWQITWSFDAPTPPPAANPDALSIERSPELKKVSVTKSGRTYHCATTFDNGETIDKWWINGVQATQWRSHRKILVSQGSGYDMFYVDFNHSDFPDLQWIAASKYVGVEKLNGVECLVFADEVPKVGPEAMRGLLPDELELAKKETIPAAVWINLKNRLPVRYQIAGRKAEYTFSESSDTPIAIPPAVEQEIAQLRAKVRQASQPAPKP